MLFAAGYAPAYPETRLDDPKLGPVRTALARILFGTAVDVTVAELRLEAFLPADEATASTLSTLTRPGAGDARPR